MILKKHHYHDMVRKTTGIGHLHGVKSLIDG